VRLVIVATVAAAVVLVGCSDEQPRSAGGSRQPTVASTRPPTIRPTIRPTIPPTISAPSTPVQRTSAGPTRRRVVDDQADDVTHTLSEGDDNPMDVRYPRADLRRVIITHGRLRVEVTERMGDLRPTIEYQEFQLVLRAPHTDLFGQARLADDGDRSLLVDWSLPEQESGDGRVHCPGLAARADFAHNLLHFVVPTRCLDTPPWVRLGLYNLLGDPDGEDYEDTLDNAWIKPDGYSARVYRP
jgi:hypothetical protein